MPHAVFYAPTSEGSQSGQIVAMVSGPVEAIESDGRPFVYVEAPSLGLDATHTVVDGHVVPKPEND